MLGGRIAVRQVIDHWHGDGQGSRAQVALWQALSRAPRARQGRPAVLMALLPPPPLLGKLREADLVDPGSGFRYLAVALAAGDGIDIGVVAGYGELGQAREAGGRLKERVAALRQRPGLRALHLDRFLEPLVVVAALAGPQRQPEVHLAYRLPGDDLSDLLGALASLRPK